MRDVTVRCPHCGAEVVWELNSDGDPVDFYQYDCECIITDDEMEALLATALGEEVPDDADP